MDKLIISAAIVGSWPTRQQSPYIPITPEEIGASALEAWREGASIVHIHVREDDGRPTVDTSRCQRVIDTIRRESADLIINLSTSGAAGSAGYDARLGPVLLKPELVSLDAGSMNFNDRVFLNPPDFLERLALLTRENNVKPEIECFDDGMITNAMRLVDKGLIAAPLWFQFVLGLKGGAPATGRQLTHMVGSLPPGALWSVCAISRAQLPMDVMAIAMGGHARTGLEDNIYYKKGELATGNGQLVARLVRIGLEMGREIASPDETRAILGIKPRSESGMA